MRLIRLLATAALVELGAYSPAVAAVPTAPTECDVLVAHPDDAERVSPGVKRDDRAPETSVPACEAAVKAHPGIARFEFQLGLALDKADRQAEAVGWYRRAASRGYVAAIYALGWAHLEGEGIGKDEAEGFRLIRQAAEKGHSAAKNTLGIVYQQGRGVEKNDVEAVRWFRTSAAEGRPSGLHNLGAAYRDGRGVERNDGEALRLFQRAAEQGHIPSLAATGWMLEKRGGTPDSVKQSISWYERAAAGGYEAGLKALDRLATTEPAAAAAAQRVRVALGDQAPAAVASRPQPPAAASPVAAKPAAGLPPVAAQVPPAAYILKPTGQAAAFDLARRDLDGWVFLTIAGATSGKVRSSLEGDNFTDLPQQLVICSGKETARGNLSTVMALAAPTHEKELRAINATGPDPVAAMIAGVGSACDLVALRAQEWLSLYPQAQPAELAAMQDAKRAVRFVSTADVNAVLLEQKERAAEEGRRREQLRQAIARGEPAGLAYLALVKPADTANLCHDPADVVVTLLFEQHRPLLAAEIRQLPSRFQAIAGLDALYGAMLSGSCSMAAGQPKDLAKLAAALQRDGIETLVLPVLADETALDRAKQDLAKRAAQEAEERKQAEAKRQAEEECRAKITEKIKRGDIKDIMPEYIIGYWAESKEKCGKDMATKYDEKSIHLYLYDKNHRDSGLEPTIGSTNWKYTVYDGYIFRTRDEYVEAWRPIDSDTAEDMSLILPDGTIIDYIHDNKDHVSVKSLKVGRPKNKMVRCGIEAEELAKSIINESQRGKQLVDRAIQDNFQAQAVYHVTWMSKMDKKCEFLTHDYQFIDGYHNSTLFEASKRVNHAYKDNLGKRLHHGLLMRADELAKSESCTSPSVRERFKYHLALLKSYQP